MHKLPKGTFDILPLTIKEGEEWKKLAQVELRRIGDAKTRSRLRLPRDAHTDL